MLPESTRQDNGDIDDDNVDGKWDNYNSGSREASTKEQIKNYTQRTQKILSEIHDLANESSSLLKLDTDFQLRKPPIAEEEKQTNSDGIVGIDPIDLHSTNKINDKDLKSKIFDINQRLIELDNELVKVNEEIIASIANLSDKFEKQKDFVNIAAHEIRSPCQAIIGYVDLLNLEPNNSKRYLDLISMNAERLSLLISNILDASRIDNKTLQIKNEKFNLIELLEKIIDDLNSRLANDSNQHTEIIFKYSQSENQKTNATIDVYKKNIIVDADRGRITQVIFNLLDNAIRFGKGNKILVTLRINIPNLYKVVENISSTEGKTLIDSPEQKQQDQNQRKIVVVQVKDAGRGMNSKVLDNLFSKFASDITSGGTGLGLFISKNIIEAHGGRIWAENNKDQKGAAFYFSLPLSLD